MSSPPDQMCSLPSLAQGLRPELSSESQSYRASQTSTTIWAKYEPPRVPHLSRPTSSLGSIEVAHTQLNKNQEDHESISDQEMDDADLAELIADVSPQLEEEIPETQL
jgi:hypothetical protein